MTTTSTTPLLDEGAHQVQLRPLLGTYVYVNIPIVADPLVGVDLCGSNCWSVDELDAGGRISIQDCCSPVMTDRWMPSSSSSSRRLKCADTTRTTGSSSLLLDRHHGCISKSNLLAGSDLDRSLLLRPSISGPSMSWQRNKSIPACLPWALIISKVVRVAAWHMPFLGIITMKCDCLTNYDQSDTSVNGIFECQLSRRTATEL